MGKSPVTTLTPVLVTYVLGTIPIVGIRRELGPSVFGIYRLIAILPSGAEVVIDSEPNTNSPEDYRQKEKARFDQHLKSIQEKLKEVNPGLVVE